MRRCCSRLNSKNIALAKTWGFALSPTLAANEVVNDRRAKGQQVLHMGFGESPFPVPPRLHQALQDHAHQRSYMASSGETKLKETILSYYDNKLGMKISDTHEVIVGPGSKLLLFALQLAIDGDLLHACPSWVSYAPQSKMLHNRVIRVPTTCDDKGFQIDPVQLRQVIHDARKEDLKPSKIILNFPNNPTGLVMPDENMAAVAKVCEEEDIFIISDEIYGLVRFDHQYRSFAKLAPEHTAITSGLSKHLSLGGWRVGYGLLPKSVPGLYKVINSIASETWSCLSSPITYAAVEAFSLHADIEEHVYTCTNIHKIMNTYISHGLRNAYAYAPMVQGGFYNYPDFEKWRKPLKEKDGITTSTQLSDHLLHNFGLVSLPGIAFGDEESRLSMRLSGCDYDGRKVLESYRALTAEQKKSLETKPEDWIQEVAPNIVAEMKVFKAKADELEL